MSDLMRENAMAQIRVAGEEMLQRLASASPADRQGKPVVAEVEAVWSISLDTTCPGCKEDVNLLDRSDFWEDTRLQPVENHTPRSNSVSVTCPKCDHEFEVRCVY